MSIFSFFSRAKSVLCPFCLAEIHFREKDKLKSCPACKSELPITYVQEFQQTPPVFLQLIGWSGSGKTTYLQSLVYKLNMMGPLWGENYFTRALTESTLSLIRSSRRFQTLAQIPPATPVHGNDPYIIQLYGMARWGDRTLVTRDIAGEYFNQLDFSLKEMPYLIHVPTISMVVSLPDLERQNFTADELINSYIQTLLRNAQNYRTDKLKVVVVLTKADRFITKLPEELKSYLYKDPFAFQAHEKTFADSKFMSAYMKELYRNSFKIKNWFSNTTQGRMFVALAERAGIQLFFTLVSSIGREDDFQSIRQFELDPLRILDPFFLTLDLSSRGDDIELDEAFKQGDESVEVFLQAKADEDVVLAEAKLILVGEGEVGKTCLMDAFLNESWQEHPSTHGIEIQQIKVTDAETQKEITLNGWDFGGQRVYRPTHQLFFSAPAVYLVVWKPREGPQQGFVKEWIQLVKRREPSAKIIVVATHGGPQQRQPDIDRQELWDLFGKETVVDFFFVDSKPDENGNRKGIEELKLAIARIAAELPEVGRSVPKRWQEVREALQQINKAYLPFEDVMELCHKHNMEDEEARLFITISHRLGHLIHYEHDPALRDIVVLKPDWLATAMSFVLDDQHTRAAHGLVSYIRLSQLWDDPNRNEDFRYPPELHSIFLRLMERFDLSYRVAGLHKDEQTNPTSLIAQLVPDLRAEGDLQITWPKDLASGDIQQIQICRIVDAQNGQSAAAEGLFYQLIVRLHKYSLGRMDYNNSIHWQRGLVLDNAYNGRAFLEHKGNDVHITVRAAYPQGFLTLLTEEVKYLVENFWEGLRCNVMVPCVKPCGINKPGNGMFEVGSLIESIKEGHPTFPCPTCNKWQDIGMLLANAPAATKPVTPDVLFAKFAKLEDEIYSIRPALEKQHEEVIGNFAEVRTEIQELFSQAENNLNIMLQALADEAKEGPRLFSLVPVDGDRFDPRNWVTSRFRLTLWCEHSRVPLPVLNQDKKIGVYEFDLQRQWVKDYAPLIKAFTITLKSLLPVAFSAAKLAIDATIYKGIEDELDFSKACIDALISETEGVGQLFTEGTIGDEPIGLPSEKVTSAQNVTLREFHALLNRVDPTRKYGNLVKVINKQQKFLWVHEKFAGEY